MSEQKVVISQQQEDGSYLDLLPKTDGYTKNETLTNEISQMFGIDNGTPEQIFQWIGKYNQNWWKKDAAESDICQEKLMDVNKLIPFSEAIIYSKEIYINPITQQINLKNYKVYTFYTGSSTSTAVSDTQSFLDENAPCYIAALYYPYGSYWDSNIYFLPSDSTATIKSQNRTIQCQGDADMARYFFGYGDSVLTKAKKVIAEKKEPATEISYLISSDRKAYPDIESFGTKETRVETSVENNQILIKRNSSVYVADNYTLVNDVFNLVNATEVSLYSSDYTEAKAEIFYNKIKGKYVQVKSDNLNPYNNYILMEAPVYIPEDGAWALNVGAGIYVDFKSIYVVSEQSQWKGTINYIGVPFDKLRDLPLNS